MARPGAGPISSDSIENAERKERLKRLAMETIDLAKDPYIFRNHIGKYECRLCLTLHDNEGNYLVHTQGKRHQLNLQRREMAEKGDVMAPAPRKVSVRKTVKIGRPGYQVTKQRDSASGQRSLVFEIHYPEIEEGFVPRHRFMSAFEQRKEAVDKKYQYLLFAAEPYETIAFKIPNEKVDTHDDKLTTAWDKDSQVFTLQFSFRLGNAPDEPVEQPRDY